MSVRSTLLVPTLATLVALGALGCDDSDPGPATGADTGATVSDTATSDARASDSASPGSCSISVTGAHAGTDACRDLSLTHDTRTTKTSFALTNPATDPAFVVVGTVTITGEEPAAKTYDQSQAAVACAITVKQGAKAWQAQKSATVNKGTCALTLSEVSVDAATPSVKSYRYKGTLRATLPANELTGATGTSELTATFEY